MSDKKKYEVIAQNTLHHEVGEIIELTDKKAAALVNKVKPYTPVKVDLALEEKPETKPKSGK